MKKIVLGIVREGKKPADKRVPLTPEQCVKLIEKFPNVDVIIQPSAIRAYTDDEYAAQGLTISENLHSCDILMGVKEVQLADLIPEKTYLFFSHTFKKQPYNRGLLRAILDKKIRLIDYEILKDANNQRLIGFGRWAGIVGCYNSFLTYGLKTQRFALKPAHQCYNRIEMEEELKKIQLPNQFKLVLTGWGRVGQGAIEVLSLLNIREVSPESFLTEQSNEPVFTQLEVGDYNAHQNGTPFNRDEFYRDASNYVSTFPRYLEQADMYMACHYYSNDAPFLVTKTDLKKPEIRVRVVGDISADIDGPVACTIRPSVIGDPIYGYDPQNEQETDFMNEHAIAVMAIDNLPCELPRDASEDFGKMLLDSVFPFLFGDSDPDLVIERASQTDLNGELMPRFKYLTDYVYGENINA
jgi:saccharopine dehydrogenase (NAD+, L-lysine forming)